MSLYLGTNKVKLRSQSATTYSTVGNPTITSDGVASGFTDKNDYLVLPAFNPGTSHWKFVTKVKIYSYSTQISLIDHTNSSMRCFQIVVRTTGKFRVNISTDGLAKANEVDGTHVLSTDTIYYISFEYDGSKYYLKYSTDNINWTTDITIDNSTKIYPVSSMSMGHSTYGSGTEKWDGEIYLRYTRFIIEGSTLDTWKLHCLSDLLAVDYIQSFGTQYIDTGISAPNGFIIKTKMSMSNSSNEWRCLCGSHESSSPYKRNFVMINYNQRLSNAGVISCGQGNGDKYARNDNIYLDTIYDIEASNIYSNTYIKINGENKNLSPGDSPSNSYSSRNLYLFADNNGSSLSNPSQYFYGKMCATQIIVNNVIVRDFIPVINTQTNEYGLYDKVSKQFFGNLGTGAFSGGNEYTRVDYIQSSGTQYIDTGVSAPNGFRFEVYLNVLDGQGRDTIVGSHNAYSPYGRNFIALNKNSLILELGLGNYFPDISAPPTNSFFVLSGNTYNDGRNNILKVNDTTIYNSSRYSNGSRSANNLLLFTNQYFIQNPDRTYLIAKMKYCKIWDNNDNLVRDMVAVKNNLSNQYGMYDNISEQFFGNSGTGYFSGGNDLNPPANVIFTSAGQYIGLYDYGNLRKYIKKYDGLAYGGYWIGDGGSGGWRFPCFVSEVRSYCETTDWITVSDTTFNRYGKDWYYSEGVAAVTGGSLVVEGDIYKIENVTTTLEAAQALLDYVYSF